MDFSHIFLALAAESCVLVYLWTLGREKNQVLMRRIRRTGVQGRSAFCVRFDMTERRQRLVMAGVSVCAGLTGSPAPGGAVRGCAEIGVLAEKCVARGRFLV